MNVLFEDYIKACPKNRYRRVMYYDSDIVNGKECIWDENTITCPHVLTATDSTYKNWVATHINGVYIIAEPKKGDFVYADQIQPGFAPSPREWLGSEPECPKPGSVVDIAF